MIITFTALPSLFLSLSLSFSSPLFSYSLSLSASLPTVPSYLPPHTHTTHTFSYDTYDTSIRSSLPLKIYPPLISRFLWLNSTRLETRTTYERRIRTCNAYL